MGMLVEGSVAGGCGNGLGVKRTRGWNGGLEGGPWI